MLESTALIAVPNDFTKDIIERNLREHISDALTAVLEMPVDRAPVSIAVTVDSSMTGVERSFEPAVADQDPHAPPMRPDSSPADDPMTERFASGQSATLLPNDRTLYQRPPQEGDVMDFVPGPRPQPG